MPPEYVIIYIYTGEFMNLFSEPTPSPFTHLIPFIQHTCSQVADELYFINPPVLFMGQVVRQILLKNKCLFIDYGSDGNIRLPVTTTMLKLYWKKSKKVVDKPNKMCYNIYIDSWRKSSNIFC